MSEYTKEQEAEALAKVAKYINPGNPGRWPDDDDIGIVLAMAKRTAEAEARADASEADAKRLADDWAAALLERNALKARVAELEQRLHKACGRIGGCLKVTCGPHVSCRCDAPAQSHETFALTRELLEMMLADAETRAVYGRGDVPLNPAARLVVALRKMLEAKP